MLTSNAYTGALNSRISEGNERNELRQYMRWKAAYLYTTLVVKCTFHSYPMIFPAYVRRLCWLLSPWTRPSFQVRPAMCHEKTFDE